MRPEKKNSKSEPTRTTKKKRQEKEKSDNACKATSNTKKQSKYWDTRFNLGSSLKDISTSHPKLSLKNNVTRFDDDRAHSKEIHRETCDKYSETVFSSYEKRRFVKTDISDFDALLGRNGLYADHMPASDLELRKKFGELTIDQLHQLHLRAKKDPLLKVYWITFVDEANMVNERRGTFQVFKFKQKVQSAIRNYTSMSALGVLEVQAMKNYPKDQKGKFFSLHAHVLCWGYDTCDPKALMDHAKGFKSNISDLPILSKTATVLEGSFSKLGRYMTKPPYLGKEVDYRKFGTGEPCLFPSRELNKHHDFRLFEYCAKVPMEQTIFGVRDGTKLRNKIVSGLKKWQSQREGTEVKLGHRINNVFKRFYADNKRFKNYRPFKVKWKKPTKRK